MKKNIFPLLEVIVNALQSYKLQVLTSRYVWS